MTDTETHEWVSFADPDEDRTWVFDLTILTSNWTCIFGNGCQGVLTEDASDLQQGCCSYGAHFSDDADRDRVAHAAQELQPDEWQFADVARKRGGPIKTLPNRESMTRLVDGACIFLNRPDFPTGAGCAFHFAAIKRGQSYLASKPEVCWQVPLRRDDHVSDDGHVTSTLREWKRRDWGDGGAEFHWWCTESPDAFVGSQTALEGLQDEIIAMTSPQAFEMLRMHVEKRRNERHVFLPHPALRHKHDEREPQG